MDRPYNRSVAETWPVSIGGTYSAGVANQPHARGKRSVRPMSLTPLLAPRKRPIDEGHCGCGDAAGCPSAARCQLAAGWRAPAQGPGVSAQVAGREQEQDP